MNVLKIVTLICTIALFSTSSHSSHCGGGHTHDHEKMAKNKEVLKKADMEENAEVSIASNSEAEAAEDQDSDSETETK